MQTEDWVPQGSKREAGTVPAVDMSTNKPRSCDANQESRTSCALRAMTMAANVQNLGREQKTPHWLLTTTQGHNDSQANTSGRHGRNLAVFDAEQDLKIWASPVLRAQLLLCTSTFNLSRGGARGRPVKVPDTAPCRLVQTCRQDAMPMPRNAPCQLSPGTSTLPRRDDGVWTRMDLTIYCVASALTLCICSSAFQFCLMTVTPASAYPL